MKKFIGALVLLGVSAAWAGGGGDSVPTPFSLKNTPKFELAAGEIYELDGRIDIRQQDVAQVNEKTGKKKIKQVNVPYLVIDLKKYPMLGNKERASDPAYPIIDRTHDWREFQGQRVRLTVVAHTLTEYDGQGKPERLVVFLDMMGREELRR